MSPLSRSIPVFAAMLVLLPASAGAAVRTCTARLTSTTITDGKLQEAKKKAIADWMVKAQGAGIQAPTWRLAAERRLICQPVPGSDASPKFECIAVGHACTITQNPAQSEPIPAAPAAKGRDVGI